VLTDSDRQTLIRQANEMPAVHSAGVTAVYHYSESGSIRRFAPHVPQTNPSHRAAVWAIDEAHSPLYWFPRDCPRISVWARDAEQQALLSEVFETESHRICAAETDWMTRVRDGRIYRYVFDAAGFEPSADADGQYVAYDVVRPQQIELLDDLLALHAGAAVELRFTPRLGALMDRILQSGLPFSFVRIRDAKR
jgi:hypothetical protein